MRNQIKKMIKKENGFTLVELLAVLVILGIIVAIAIPAIGNVVDNAETKAADAEQSLVIDAARLYDIENDISSEGVSVAELRKSGYLDTKDGKSIADSVTVVVTTKDQEKTYSIK
ncbi:prepilin-type N-terminal cleavage/methylation domain-containing protein [Marinilactibacillus sp. GCM10026970]|uniref:prepilin-type N-terminal cleavage/methylation domain-containing protein n=1 Tax=Marinilactibacillus sp. GCM10026970 TaxID=3252642 RepID=UPI0036067A56